MFFSYLNLPGDSAWLEEVKKDDLVFFPADVDFSWGDFEFVTKVQVTFHGQCPFCCAQAALLWLGVNESLAGYGPIRCVGHAVSLLSGE